MQVSRYVPEEPICAIATALAPAALGIVRCSGAGCIELVSSIFSRPDALCAADGNSIVYGWIQDGTAKIDEALISVFRAPKSFTGEDMAEISCHGGIGIVLAIRNLLLKIGFRQAERGEFTFRAYINGKADLTKAEAVQEIIDSRTAEGRSRAVGRLSGNLFTEIDAVKKLLTETLAAIEVEIEYPEDEETIADSFDRSALLCAEAALQRLADSWMAEKLYQDGARVVLCGRTNAGKSSLFNALLKEERAIVSKIAGTTRDFLESWADFAGIPVRLFDTAGLRATEDAIEAQGVELSRALSTDADVILYLIDGRMGLTDEDCAFLAGRNAPAVIVQNKSDAADFKPCKTLPPVEAEVCVSAKTGTGLPELFSAVKMLLVKETSQTERLQVGLGSARQKSAVDSALESVRHALLPECSGLSADAVVHDLEEALYALGEITGEVSADDILETIFNRFCVGK